MKFITINFQPLASANKYTKSTTPSIPHIFTFPESILCLFFSMTFRHRIDFSLPINETFQPFTLVNSWMIRGGGKCIHSINLLTLTPVKWNLEWTLIAGHDGGAPASMKEVRASAGRSDSISSEIKGISSPLYTSERRIPSVRSIRLRRAFHRRKTTVRNRHSAVIEPINLKLVGVRCKTSFRRRAEPSSIFQWKTERYCQTVLGRRNDAGYTFNRPSNHPCYATNLTMDAELQFYAFVYTVIRDLIFFCLFIYVFFFTTSRFYIHRCATWFEGWFLFMLFFSLSFYWQYFFK